MFLVVFGVTFSLTHGLIVSYNPLELNGSTPEVGNRKKGETTIFDQSIRSIWLREQLWPALRNAFPQINRIPEEALITVGYPSSGARGRSEKIRPCEVNTQWTGNENEQVFISIHPVYCDTSLNMAKAILFQAGKHCMGARWGARHLGLDKRDDGTITASVYTQAKIEDVLKDIGEPPAGHGIAFPVRDVQRSRLLEYRCEQPCTFDYGARLGHTHPRIRAANSVMEVTCKHCGGDYKLA